MILLSTIKCYCFINRCELNRIVLTGNSDKVNACRGGWKVYQHSSADIPSWPLPLYNCFLHLAEELYSCVALLVSVLVTALWWGWMKKNNRWNQIPFGIQCSAVQRDFLDITSVGSFVCIFYFKKYYFKCVFCKFVTQGNSLWVFYNLIYIAHFLWLWAVFSVYSIRALPGYKENHDYSTITFCLWCLNMSETMSQWQ